MSRHAATASTDPTRISPKAHEFVMRLEAEAARQETAAQG